VAEQILAIHEQFNIPATWAVVGLAAEVGDRKESLDYFFKHVYRNEIDLNNSEFRKFVACKELSSFGKVFGRILETNKQEIASHTYNHIFLNDFLNNLDLINEDFEKFNTLMSSVGVKVNSIVLPKNIFFLEFSEILINNKIKCVRVNPDNFLYSGLSYKEPTRWIRYLRALDYYLPINEIVEIFKGKNIARSEKIPPQLVLSEATLFLRGSIENNFVNRIAYWRFVLSIWYRIYKKESVHVWTHPHNFGSNPKQSMFWYLKMIKYVKSLERRNLIRISGMGSLER